MIYDLMPFRKLVLLKSVIKCYIYCQNWYFYNDRNDRLVYISITSLLFGVFSIGLSVGVIIAVGALLIIQVLIACVQQKILINDYF